MGDNWIEEFKDRATPRLKTLFTSGEDMSVLPPIIAEPLTRLAHAEQARELRLQKGTPRPGEARVLGKLPRLRERTGGGAAEV